MLPIHKLHLHYYLMRPPPHNKESKWIYYIDIAQITKKIVTNYIISFFFTRAKAVDITAYKYAIKTKLTMGMSIQYLRWWSHQQQGNIEIIEHDLNEKRYNELLPFTSWFLHFIHNAFRESIEIFDSGIVQRCWPLELKMILHHINTRWFTLWTTL